MDWKGKKIVVVGLGASGVAAARLGLRRGACVVGTDRKAAADLSEGGRALVNEGATLSVGGHAAAGLDKADLIVISPGVPSFAELEAAERAGVPVIGEIEMAVRCLREPAPVVAVGGTNGKSTTTSLIAAMLEAQGVRTFAGGNLGEPLADHVDERFGAVVLEVSSFQMERAPTFKPRVSVLLNISEDHLDRYPSFEAYAHAKGNAFAQQMADDIAIVPAQDAACLRQAQRGKARIVTFGPGGTIDVVGNAVVDTRSGERYARSEITLAGGHNALNVAAAVAASTALGVQPEAIRRVLRAFRGLPHRMVLVRELRGVRYYDDSKGTNVGAVVTALAGITEAKAVVIAGGRDKGGSYAPLVDALAQKGRAAVLIGEAADALAGAIGEAIPIRRARTLDEAVRISAELARPGDAVLLSPACSSYDMFRDYKHRGDEFVRAVNALEGGSS
jgi:UDP-N-acetylmuramoylalanine--D-glutamate ligase